MLEVAGVARARALSRIEPSAFLIHVTWSLLGYIALYAATVNRAAFPLFTSRLTAAFTEGICLHSSLSTLQA